MRLSSTTTVVPWITILFVFASRLSDHRSDAQTPVPSSAVPTVGPAAALTEPTFEPTVSTYPTITTFPTPSATYVPTTSILPTSKTMEPTASYFPSVVDDFPTATTEAPSDACGVCDPGETMETPDRVIPPMAGGFTCGQLDQALRNVTTAGQECQSVLDGVNPVLRFLDLQAFCGCSGARPPKFCSLCEDGTDVPETNAQTSVDVPGFGSVTCEQAEAFTDYVSNATGCRAWNVALSDPCCAGGAASSPTGAPAPPSPSSSAAIHRTTGFGATFVIVGLAAATLALAEAT